MISIASKRALCLPKKIPATYKHTIHSSLYRMASTQESSKTHFPSQSLPGENFEPRQTHPTEDYKPDPSKSIPLSPARQALVDDIIALYSCEPTVQRVKRYTPDCVYDDQFVYANDRFKMAGQWFALPKLFNASINEGYQIVKNDRDLIQFRNEQVSPFKSMPACISFSYAFVHWSTELTDTTSSPGPSA